MTTVYVRLPDGGDSYIARMPDGKDTYNMAFPGLACQPSMMPDPNDFTSPVWIPQGTATVTPNVEVSPSGAQDADLIKVGPSGGDELQLVLTGIFTPNVDLDLKFWCKRVTTAGILRLENLINAVEGIYYIDLAMLSDDWELIDYDHPAVSGNLFKATGGGNLVASFSPWAAVEVRQIHAWCMYIVEV